MKKYFAFYLLLILFFSSSFKVEAQYIAVMGALEQEIDLLLGEMEKQKKIQIGGIDFYKGKINGKKVVVLKAGVGKVNASYSTAVLTQNFGIDALIFTGVAGGLHPESLPGDIIIGDRLFQHDFGKFDQEGFEVTTYRELTGAHQTDLFIPSDSILVFKSKQAAQQVAFNALSGRNPNVFTGLIATGDMFVSSPEKAQWLFGEYGALAAEMEGAAVGHICRTLDIPFVVIRSCSDNANHDARVNFEQFVGPASINSSRLVLSILEDW
ncbi:5'-methylthioadenosine/adenosylhomocysteine nucleosidase [Shivajiella indica]|uniref:adenosylhomocysteine nucleosidase n=1 Tax=Shivajiella indica TaxID=872115 RepID=A0ABW5B965_9BACT